MEGAFLATSAHTLGDYMYESEYDLLQDEFNMNRPANFQEFVNWVRGYMFYHVVYCLHAGCTKDVMENLEQVYEELVHEFNNRQEAYDNLVMILAEDDNDYIMENIIEIEDPCPQW